MALGAGDRPRGGEGRRGGACFFSCALPLPPPYPFPPPPSIFGFGGFGGGDGGAPPTPRGDDVRVDLDVDLADVYSGASFSVVRDKVTLAPAPGKRKCNCRVHMRTRQIGPGEGGREGGREEGDNHPPPVCF